MRTALAVSLGLIVAIGCSTESTPVGSKYLLNREPDDGATVIKVRAEAKNLDDVVVIGRIGGSANPWVLGRAAFSIVDPSLKSCTECGSDGCPKPWDYC